MNSDKIYLGTIKKCTRHIEEPVYISSKSEIYKKDAILVKTKNKLFIDVENLNLLEIMRLYLEDIKSINGGKRYMSTHFHGTYLGELFVDSAMRYNLEDKSDKVSLMKLKREYCKK